MLVCKYIEKKYGDFLAIGNINLELNQGINLLIGSNGAGKSTLLNILATVKKPTAGEVSFDGKNIFSKEYRNILGFLPQDFMGYENLTGFEFLMYMASIKGVDGNIAKDKINDYLRIFNLSQSANRRLGGYSGGMNQRIGIIQALINNPKILIMDEPFNALDPEERRVGKNLLKEMSKDCVIILSSHVLQELEEFEGTVICLDRGKMVSFGNSFDLKEKYGDNFLEKHYFDVVKKAERE